MRNESPDSGTFRSPLSTTYSGKRNWVAVICHGFQRQSRAGDWTQSNGMNPLSSWTTTLVQRIRNQATQRHPLRCLHYTQASLLPRTLLPIQKPSASILLAAHKRPCTVRYPIAGSSSPRVCVRWACNGQKDEDTCINAATSRSYPPRLFDHQQNMAEYATVNTASLALAGSRLVRLFAA